jgi:hypothetical protein
MIQKHLLRLHDVLQTKSINLCLIRRHLGLHVQGHKLLNN